MLGELTAGMVDSVYTVNLFVSSFSILLSLPLCCVRLVYFYVSVAFWMSGLLLRVLLCFECLVDFMCIVICVSSLLLVSIAFWMCGQLLCVCCVLNVWSTLCVYCVLNIRSALCVCVCVVFYRSVYCLYVWFALYVVQTQWIIVLT